MGLLVEAVEKLVAVMVLKVEEQQGEVKLITYL
jgi:hypothetical protein